MQGTHPLRAIPPGDTAAVWEAVNAALRHGDALCVTEGDAPAVDVPRQCAVVVLTSGSTGTPKRVMLSADALRASARATAEALGQGHWVRALPLDYIAGLMVYVRAAESDTVPVDYTDEHFDAHRFAALTNSLEDATWFTALVPTQLTRIVDLAEQDDSARRAFARYTAILVGGQAISADLISRADKCGLTIVRTYGSAETAGGVVYEGTPIGHTTVRVTEEGIIEIAGPSLALGYLGDPKRTEEFFPVDADGTQWWRTTDRGFVTDGQLTVQGRVDDIIVSGGIKVSLGDIERVLQDEGIECAASWFPDETWGQVPALVSTVPLNRDETRDLIDARLGKAARPYRFVTVTTIPRLTSGKLDRRALHQLVTESPS